MRSCFRVHEEAARPSRSRALSEVEGGAETGGKEIYLAFSFILVILINSFTNLMKDYACLYFDCIENRKKSEIFHREIFKAIKNKIEVIKTTNLEY